MRERGDPAVVKRGKEFGNIPAPRASNERLSLLTFNRKELMLLLFI
jgi:hypothetical protein